MQFKNAEYYIDGILNKDRRVLSKTITLMESSRKEHQELSVTILDKLLHRAGKAIRLGITGVPGVGKSQFIESLGIFLIKQNLSVCVLAVDPSSKKSGGSILADKTRMEKLCREDKAFIRPSPAGKTLGGVAEKTREAMVIY
jgi:LAO/AO transport system kinase